MPLQARADYLAAKIYYLKARKLRPLEPAIARNIAMTNRHFRDDVALPAPDFVSRAMQVLESKLSMDALSVLLLAAVLLLNIFLFLLLTRGRSRTAPLCAGLFPARRALAWAPATSAARPPWAVVTAPLSATRDRARSCAAVPGEDNTVLFKVNPGLEVRIIDRRGDWVQVTASERIAGWIEKKRLALI